ncbi:MAG: 5-oxoprolinase subunit PxpA [Oscillospiraceae bacterium]|jgi:UPF0271 protein|nr:5-oxoprolinase subunit PxpA [Oscillospiraceae bacterium]
MAGIDLNSDLGESFGAYTIGDDARVIPLITSANVACGFHGGDPVVLRDTIARCIESGVSIGAHPGYPDLQGFGRRPISMSVSDAEAFTAYQVAAVYGMCKAQGARLIHVKLHGALYNRAGADYPLARAICESIIRIDPELILLALSGSEMVRAARDVGMRVAQEAFADRAYEEDGSLVARTKPGAMILDESEAVRRVVEMVRGGTVEAITGKRIPIQADSICVHGDNEHALAFVKRLREALEAASVKLCAFGQTDKSSLINHN